MVHILQLLIALGSGGVQGLGLGASRQKFFYVPGAHTDGIFAIIGEELGFLGCMVVLIPVRRCSSGAGCGRATRAYHSEDQFASLLAIGITCWIGYEAVINIGGITRSIPMTGIPLPLLSYGGSAMMATLAGIGVLLNVSRHPATQTADRRACLDGSAEPCQRTRQPRLRRRGPASRRRSPGSVV